MTAISLTVNGRRVKAEVAPRTHLADFLREHLRLTGTHLGCEHGVCGACTVLVEDKPVRACITYAVACDGFDVRTIEGFEDDGVMAELRTAFSREHGLQCGFCTAGMLIMARDVVRRLPGADERRIRAELAGNLCRCTGYLGIVRAVTSVGGEGHKSVSAPSEVPRPEITAAPAPVAAAAAMPLAPVSRSSTAVNETKTRDARTHIEESFVVLAPLAAAWAALADFPAVAQCLPGAELTEHTVDSARGRLKVKIGPIAASFAGSATVRRDEPSHTAEVKGAGSDGLSHTRTRGDLTYRLVTEGPERTRVEVALDYDLQGPLAQFARSSLARDLAARIMAEFAANLNARLGAGATEVRPQAASLNVFQLLWQVLRERLGWLFGR
ncbi:MAG TPA: 2Fe-2S iron-sulfur cluster-binding protein [Stellaceae bacterium]|nr:2Fe-2S iron-sulfur cluster-binding protein [Stellaceae bacterium]